MRKIFTIFLIAVTISAFWNRSAPYSMESVPAAVEAENEENDNISVAIPAPQIDNTNIPEPVAHVLEPDEATENVAEVMYYTEEEVVMLAKLLQRECGGVKSVTEQACVAWTVCNRVNSDEFDGDTVAEVVTARHQFAYYYDTPIYDNLYELALDVLTRWNAELNGEESVGRVLPREYTYFTGDGKHNYFRDTYKGGYSIWDYSLPSPYES